MNAVGDESAAAENEDEKNWVACVEIAEACDPSKMKGKTLWGNVKVFYFLMIRLLHFVVLDVFMYLYHVHFLY